MGFLHNKKKQLIKDSHFLLYQSSVSCKYFNKARLENMLVCGHSTGSTRNVRVKNFLMFIPENFFLVTNIL